MKSKRCNEYCKRSRQGLPTSRTNVSVHFSCFAAPTSWAFTETRLLKRSHVLRICKSQCGYHHARLDTYLELTQSSTPGVRKTTPAMPMTQMLPPHERLRSAPASWKGGVSVWGRETAMPASLDLQVGIANHTGHTHTHKATSSPTWTRFG